MKQFISLFLCIILLISLFSGCAGDPNAAQNSDQLVVVTTIFPIYDWVRQITGSETELTMLLDNGVDLHNFQPSAADIAKIASCDLFSYVGGESDEWTADVLRQVTNPDMVVVNLLDALGDAARAEELVEGMQPEDEEEEEEALDEHIWLSLKNAQALCPVIRDALTKADAAHADLYAQNTAAYLDRLAALDAEYQAAVDEAKYKTLLFGDRFPFRYLTEDYGLSYYAAFMGCSAEAEASFETVVFLAGKLDELQLPAILQIESADGALAETIRSTSRDKNQQILTLNSLQSVTGADLKNGVSYLDVMAENLEILRQALG